MLNKKDYSKLTNEELMSEEKKMTSQKIPTALFIGFLVGGAIWSATHKGGFLLTIIALIFAFIIGKWSSQNMKGIQDELSNRKSKQ